MANESKSNMNIWKEKSEIFGIVTKRTYTDIDYCEKCNNEQEHTIYELYVKEELYWDEIKSVCNTCGSVYYT